MHYSEPEVVIVGAGIAGGALGTVLARTGFEVVLLERENSYPDRVRGEFIVPWGVTELAKLELLQPLREAGALFTRRNIPYDEIFAQLAPTAGASVFRGVGDISVTSGSRPIVSCLHNGASLEFRPRLVIG